MYRPPQIELSALLQQQAPQIDLKIHAFDVSTRDFIKAITNFKNKAQALITERRNAQAAEVKRVAEKALQIEAETNRFKMKEIELLSCMRFVTLLL